MIRRLAKELLEREPPRAFAAVASPRVERAPTPEAHARELLAALLADELELAPERVRPLVARTLAHFRGDAEVIVHVHPDDVALLEPATLARTFDLTELRLHADPSMARGGCIVAAARGTLDARVETRIERMLALLSGS